MNNPTTCQRIGCDHETYYGRNRFIVKCSVTSFKTGAELCSFKMPVCNFCMTDMFEDVVCFSFYRNRTGWKFDNCDFCETPFEDEGDKMFFNFWASLGYGTHGSVHSLKIPYCRRCAFNLFERMSRYVKKEGEEYDYNT